MLAYSYEPVVSLKRDNPRIVSIYVFYHTNLALLSFYFLCTHTSMVQHALYLNALSPRMGVF